jgi:hypothetical protein
METNKSEIDTGDFVLIEDTLHEILAVDESYNGFSKTTRYSIAYASGEFPAIKIRLHYTTETLNINKASSITEVTIPVIRADSVQTSKYGSPHDMAERLLENAQHRGLDRYPNVQVTNFMVSNTGMVAARQAASLYSPEPYGDMISIYKNAKDRKRTRRSTMKPGRAFKHMLEKAEDKEIAKLTETYIEAIAPREFILKEGTSRAAFRRAYCGIRADNRNVEITRMRKALARSCMHTLKVESDEPEEDMSPAEIFASGDFMVAWLETTDKKIAARVVFSIKEGHTKTHAPIYGACEQSINELEYYMKDMEVSNVTEWAGMRVLRIDTPSGQIGPYMDCGIKGEEVDGYIELCEDGTISFESTDGYTSDGIYCENCNEVHQEEEMCQTPEGDMICRDCFDANYICLDDGEVYSINEVEEVAYFCKHTNRVKYNWVHRDEAVYCEEQDEWWMEGEVTQTDCGGYYMPTHMIPDYPELFLSHFEDQE